MSAAAAVADAIVPINELSLDEVNESLLTLEHGLRALGINSAPVPSVVVSSITDPDAAVIVNSAPVISGATLAPGGISPHSSDSDESVLRPGWTELANELDGELIEGPLISRGGYATVHRGIWRREGLPDEVVAIKYLIDGAHMGSDEITGPQIKERNNIRLRRESNVWQRTNHRNILPFHGFQSEPKDCLVSPLCPKGHLAQCVKINPELSVVDRLVFLKQAAEGLQHLHDLDPPVSHGDIKPENILLNDTPEAVLCDFGLSRVLLGLGLRTGYTTSGRNLGTNGYMAPELLNDEVLASLEADIFAFACLILTVLSGAAPYHKVRPPAQRMMAVVEGKYPVPEDHPGLPEQDPLWKFLRNCWNVDPKLRPKIQDVVNELQAEIDGRINK